MQEILLSYLAAFLLGVSKAGLKGLGTVVVALMALAFGAKASTGIVLPLLLVGDVIAVIFYTKTARWKYVWKFLPYMLVGIGLGAYFGESLPEQMFKMWMSAILLISVALLIYREQKANALMPKGIWFIGSTGLVAGFATMIGNLAGGFSNLYFLSTRLTKNEIIGTAAWLFLIVNLSKLPFHIFLWGTINLESLREDLVLVPALLIGFAIGLKLVKKFNEKAYRYFLLAVTAIGALLILLK